MAYADQRERVLRLNMRGMNAQRFDCFGCGGTKSLSVNVASGQMSWYCFRASCDVRGRLDRPRSAAELRQVRTTVEPARAFTLPQHIVGVGTALEAVEWMRKNHVYDAWRSGRAEIRFDPKANRIVFLIRNRGELIDAAGRALSKLTKPKWLRYGASEKPLFIGDNDNLGVIVEDAASACAVSGLATGVALLGTNLTDAAIGYMRHFKRCIVALDPDATGKALEYQQILTRYVPTSVVRLTDDLKYFNEDRIAQELRL